MAKETQRVSPRMQKYRDFVRECVRRHDGDSRVRLQACSLEWNVLKEAEKAKTSSGDKIKIAPEAEKQASAA